MPPGYCSLTDTPGSLANQQVKPTLGAGSTGFLLIGAMRKGHLCNLGSRIGHGS